MLEINFPSNSIQLRLAEIIQIRFTSIEIGFEFDSNFASESIKFNEKSMKNRSGAAQSRTSAAEILAGAGKRAPHRQNNEKYTSARPHNFANPKPRDSKSQKIQYFLSSEAPNL